MSNQIIPLVPGRGCRWLDDKGGWQTGTVLNGWIIANYEIVQSSYHGPVVLVPCAMLEPWPRREEWERDSIKTAVVKEPVT